MSNSKEVESLLKNIQKGLRLYSVQDLNQAIVKFLNTKNDKSVDINKVMIMVCKEYNITKTSLHSKNARGNLQEAKQICYCLLHFNLGLSIRHISEKIFFNWPTSVSIGIKKLKTADVKHKQDKKFIERYEKLQNQLITELCV